MKYAILITTIALTGCYQTVNLNDINTSIKACGSLDQIVTIIAGFEGTEAVECANRNKIYLTEKVYEK